MKTKQKLIDSLTEICKEWERQKNLFPILNRDGWMDGKIQCANNLLDDIKSKKKTKKVKFVTTAAGDIAGE